MRRNRLQLTRYNAFALRYLVISDIHANLEALEKALVMARGRYARAVCLGDLVGYGPNPNEVIERVRELTALVIRGNHDKASAGIMEVEDFNPLARQAIFWTRQQLTPEHMEFLRALPTGPVTLNGFQISHGSPLDEDEYIFGPSEALPTLQSLTSQTVFFGHTHWQGGFILTPQGQFHSVPSASRGHGCTGRLPLEDGSRYLVNPGSVGQPRDGDRRAAFAILDEDKQQVEFYRTPYDLSATQVKMREAGLPEPLIRRLELGR